MNSFDFKVVFEENGSLVHKLAFKKGNQGAVLVGKKGQKVDIEFQSESISRFHAQLIFDGNSLFIQDLGSTNGTFLNGIKISTGNPHKLEVDNIVSFSNDSACKMYVVHYERAKSDLMEEPNGNSGLLLTDVSSLLRKKQLITIGRLEECDVILNQATVSRKHAQIEVLSDGRFKVKDLNSANGTFVNGKRISTQIITEQDRLMIGRYVIPLKGTVKDISREIAIQAEGISKVYANGFVGLNSTSFSVPSHSLLAIMGPSGCGKSTLMKALNGDSPPTSGRVRLFNLDLIGNYEYLKTQIGYVPQDDIVHRELTVFQSLYYAARLRLEHESDEYIHNKIDQLLFELNINHIKENMVASISGGQRKRVSIAVELLNDPMILFLDEPTSPLDPQTIEEFLGILKKLAQKGTTIVMVTHKPEDLDYMDSVIFMAEGGFLVYYSSANQYKEYFGVSTAVEVYANISGQTALQWINRYNVDQPESKSNPIENSIKHSRSTNSLKQFFWLSARYFKIKTNDKLNTAIMVFQAPIIAFLIYLVFEKINMSVPFLMTISAIWFGANNSAREIVKELPIYKRERMFNVKLIPYVGSKLIVLTLFAFLQSVLFVSIIYFFYKNTGLPWNDPFSSVLWMVAITSSASLMGLMLSALLDSTEKVMSLVPITLIPQIMLAGIIEKINNPIVEFLSYLTLSRWGTVGMSIIQNKIYIPDENKVADVKPVLSARFHSKYEEIFGEHAYKIELDITAIGILSLLFFICILYFLKNKDSVMR